MYFVKAPFWLRLLYRPLVWRIPEKEKVIYLTFDDGPHAIVTPFVLEQLEIYAAKASFFCIGKNVEADKSLFERVLKAGHKVGNHTQNHVNGWKMPVSDYLENIDVAANHISSSLFRPPYGRIRFAAISKVKALINQRNRENGHQNEAKIVMWDVLSGDFDEKLTGQQCFQNVIKHTQQGSIVVFHDSEKAFKRLQYTLPKVLEYYSKRGYLFKVIPA